MILWNISPPPPPPPVIPDAQQLQAVITQIIDKTYKGYVLDKNSNKNKKGNCICWLLATSVTSWNMSPPLPPVIPDAQQLRTVITQIIAKGYVFDKNSQKNIVWK